MRNSISCINNYISLSRLKREILVEEENVQRTENDFTNTLVIPFTIPINVLIFTKSTLIKDDKAVTIIGNM
jgi:hypothetical protein